MLMIPLRYTGSAFAKFCVSSQDSAEKVNLQTLQFAAALCTTPLTDAGGNTYADWLAEGMSSIQSHWNGSNPTGLYLVEVNVGRGGGGASDPAEERGLEAHGQLPRYALSRPHELPTPHIAGLSTRGGGRSTWE